MLCEERSSSRVMQSKLAHLVWCLKKRGLPFPAIVEVATILGICWKRASGRLVYFPGTVPLHLPFRVGSVHNFTPVCTKDMYVLPYQVTWFSDKICDPDMRFSFPKIRKLVCRSIHPNGWILDLYVCTNWYTSTSNAWYCIDKKTQKTDLGWKPLRVVAYLSNHAPADWTWSMSSTENKQYEIFMLYWSRGALSLDSL
jgi:hypothetical protein